MTRAVARDVQHVDARPRPRETSASPHAVATGSGPEPSKPGSAYVPEPVRIPIAMAAAR